VSGYRLSPRFLLEKNAMPELQTHSFGKSASPFPTFLDLFAPFQYISVRNQNPSQSPSLESNKKQIEQKIA
jgi:hypothetical protein